MKFIDKWLNEDGQKTMFGSSVVKLVGDADGHSILAVVLLLVRFIENENPSQVFEPEAMEHLRHATIGQLYRKADIDSLRASWLILTGIHEDWYFGMKELAEHARHNDQFDQEEQLPVNLKRSQIEFIVKLLQVTRTDGELSMNITTGNALTDTLERHDAG